MSYRRGAYTGRPKPRDCWRTPPEFYAALDREFGFGLDAACTSADCVAPRGLCVDQGTDAMLTSWLPGPVWLNPPYSHLEPWLGRARLFGARTTVAALVPADPSTGWWRNHVMAHASEVRFVIGRLRFLDRAGEKHETKKGGGGITVPSAVVVYEPAGGPPRYSYMERTGRKVDLNGLVVNERTENETWNEGILESASGTPRPTST